MIIDTNFHDILTFQRFINHHHQIDNFNEFIRFSKSIFWDVEFPIKFDYLKTTFYYGEDGPIINLEQFIDIREIFVTIPCILNQHHAGVYCNLYRHLTGIGCLDCFYDDGICAQMFPTE